MSNLNFPRSLAAIGAAGLLLGSACQPRHEVPTSPSPVSRTALASVSTYNSARGVSDELSTDITRVSFTPGIVIRPEFFQPTLSTSFPTMTANEMTDLITRNQRPSLTSTYLSDEQLALYEINFAVTLQNVVWSVYQTPRNQGQVWSPLVKPDFALAVADDEDAQYRKSSKLFLAFKSIEDPTKLASLKRFSLVEYLIDQGRILPISSIPLG